MRLSWLMNPNASSALCCEPALPGLSWPRMKSCVVVGLAFQLVAGACIAGASLPGCGGSSAPPPRASDAATVTEPPPATSPSVAAAREPDPEAQPKEDAPAETKPAGDEKRAEAASKDVKNPDEQRQIKYVVSPEGLRVEVAGVRFMVSAEAKKVGQGWAVKLGVKAESADGKQHTLLNPKNGPIALSAAVYPKGKSAAERTSDTREGEGELAIPAGSPINFSRDFPGKGGRPLAIGETLDLQAALWGLGENADDRRPVKQFVHVRMAIDQGKPKAIVEPPPSAAK